jgi:EAL domain-containing protein (putative c-di-GMP-specific phosphodiesterase class I)
VAQESAGIDIEITEGVLIDDVSSAVAQLRVLRRSGVRVAIDDFGTGYSSLSRLAELPVDMLKIDRSFVSQLTSSGAGRTVAETIITLGKAFNMTTLAEGVETTNNSNCWLSWVATSRRDTCTAVRSPPPTLNPC